MSGQGDIYDRRRPPPGGRSRGWTLFELVATVTVMAVLSLAAVPSVRLVVRSRQERQLREALRQMREAIAEFRRDAVLMPCHGEAGTFGWQAGDTSHRYAEPRSRVVISDCALFGPDNPDRYPPSLEVLAEGVQVVPRAADLAALGGTQGARATLAKGSPGRKRYLRAVPVDPLTGRAEWDLRSNFDPPGATGWGGENVFSVRSKSDQTALNGEKYSDW